MYPLDVTQVVLRRWRAGVRGRIDPRIGIGAGAPACLRRQACSRPCQSDVLSHAWCQACVELCLLAREGSMLGWVIVSCIMPWRSSFPFFFFFFLVEESLHAHRCQSYQQSERQIKQTTGECRVGSTSYDKGSCFSIA